MQKNDANNTILSIKKNKSSFNPGLFGFDWELVLVTPSFFFTFSFIALPPFQSASLKT